MEPMRALTLALLLIVGVVPAARAQSAEADAGTPGPLSCTSSNECAKRNGWGSVCEEGHCESYQDATDLFIAIGTSGTVSPASNFVRAAAYAGARTIFVNLEPMTPHNPAFQEVVLGRAEEALPRLFAEA